jgi:site-specific DNA-methyltransferase (cytosine-N4-specific)
MTEAYATQLGRMLEGDAMDVVNEGVEAPQLIVTSPPWCRPTEPFRVYLDWLREMFAELVEVMKKDGSLVVIHGQEWDPPFQTIRVFEALKVIGELLPICQQFVVDVDDVWTSASVREDVDELLAKRVRSRPSHGHAWWYGVNPKVRRLPSSSVIGVETVAADRRYWGAGGTHSSALPVGAVLPFVEGLTEPGDLVFDPFAGSNAVGCAAELAGRRWLSVERDWAAIEDSRLRWKL